MMSLPELFSYIRKAQEIKQKHVSIQAGIAQPSLAKFESGKAGLSIDTLLRIAPLINMNPLYISGEHPNPFLSDALIKIRLPEGFLSGIHFNILYFLAEKNTRLDIILLIAPLGLYRLLTRSVFENPVFAIAVRDDFNNYFMLRRKSNNPIYGEREMLSRLNEISQESRTLISTSVSKIINKDLLGKIMDWTVTKDDVEHLFSDLKKIPLVPTEKEEDLLRKIREKNIDPHTIIKDFFGE